MRVSVCVWLARRTGASQGFTREFLRGGVGTSEELLHELRDAVEDISRDKKVDTRKCSLRGELRKFSLTAATLLELSRSFSS